MLDRVYLKNKFGLTHEVIAEKIITSELKEIIESIRRSPDAPFERPLDVFIISRLIKKGGEQELDFIWKPLHQIIRGAYDADKMDFLYVMGCYAGNPVLQGRRKAHFTSFLALTVIFPITSFFSSPVNVFYPFSSKNVETVYYHPTVRLLKSNRRNFT